MELQAFLCAMRRESDGLHMVTSNSSRQLIGRIVYEGKIFVSVRHCVLTDVLQAFCLAKLE